MRYVIDIETNSLKKPTKVHLIVCKDLMIGSLEIFREVTTNPDELKRFREYERSVDGAWIGHNLLGFDLPTLADLNITNIPIKPSSCIDTLICSKLIDYSRVGGHSLEQYGEEFGYPKHKFNDFTRWSQELEDYCVRDVEITERIYNKYKKYILTPVHKPSIELEHKFQLICNDLHNNGFAFNAKKASELLDWVLGELEVLDKEIQSAFPPRLKLIREITPRLTKHGTLNRSDFRWVADGDLSDFNGGPFSRCTWVEFNPSSPKQIIDVLWGAGWSPTDKTKTHVETLRELSRQKWTKDKLSPLDFETQSVILQDKLEQLKRYGWRVNEENLTTLPDDAPAPARSLARRILLEARRRTLVEWLGLFNADTKRIHSEFRGIGTWTHRTATQRPNMQNIPNEKDDKGNIKLLGKEFRSLWIAPKNRLLVGVDAEGIQLRIFAHYVNDPELTESLVNGKKSEKTDPHSLNQRILGGVCKTRQAAKRTVFTLFLGGGFDKFAEILGCSKAEAEEAIARLIARYPGFRRLREEVIPVDARRGYFTGLDGRKVSIPGQTLSERRHLAMSGYLQNGEAVVMKLATLEWYERLEELAKNEERLWWVLVDLIHDEWQVECNNDMRLAVLVAKAMAESLKTVGERLQLNCPLAGSYWNDDLNDYTIGTKWSVTH